jgi:hypothetical protein
MFVCLLAATQCRGKRDLLRRKRDLIYRRCSFLCLLAAIQCKLGLFSSLVGLFSLYIRPLLSDFAPFFTHLLLYERGLVYSVVGKETY